MAQERPQKRAATSSPLEPGWEKRLTADFRQKLSTQRMTELSSRSTSRSGSPALSYSRHSSPQPIDVPLRHGAGRLAPRSPLNGDEFELGAPPSATSLANIPLVPAPCEDGPSIKFRNQLVMLAETPVKWENPGLLDEAMESIPLDRIYKEADAEAQSLQAAADKIGKKPAWAWQDCVIRALLKWFRGTFFTWVNNPPCTHCQSPTIVSGHVAPTPDEKARSGNIVELYRCSVCGAEERFPRYNDAFVLLQTRRGRCGEWATCFSMLCRAVGSRVRWIWNSEDHVWTEVYSEHRKRWVHVDACEGQFDKPLLYSDGWAKKMAYCIAFSADGATDVTRRYCRNPTEHGLPRTRCSEANLLHIIDEIRALRRRNREKDEKFRLEGEDMRESRELRHYYVATITSEVAKLAVPRPKTAAELADEQKARESSREYQARQSGNPDWIRDRREDGNRRDQQ